jgi:hypothetical protein
MGCNNWQCPPGLGLIGAGVTKRPNHDGAGTVLDSDEKGCRLLGKTMFCYQLPPVFAGKQGGILACCEKTLEPARNLL